MALILMSLETRRVRGDLIEVYKFFYTIDSDIFLNTTGQKEEDILKNCSNGEVDLTLESMCLAIG